MNKTQFMMGVSILEQTGKKFELPELKDIFEKKRELTKDQWFKECKAKMTSKDWGEVNKLLF